VANQFIRKGGVTVKQILVEVDKCLGCKSCEIACVVAHSETGDLIGAFLQNPQPVRRVFVEAGEGFNLPLQCRQCEEPKCVQACMSGAMRKEVSGLVSNDPDKCVGCWMCVMVCPFGAITRDVTNKLAAKCDRCAGLDQPACVRACPTEAIQFLDVDDFCKSGRKKYLTNFRCEMEV